jgi:Superfamily II DNA helicase
LFYENSVDLLRALKKHFGYDQFRPLQEEIIRDALAGSDVFVLGANPARKQPAKFYCR